MKNWLIRYHGFLGLAAAVLIFGSWILTSTLQQNIDSIDKKISALAVELRLGVFLDSLEFIGMKTQSRLIQHVITSESDLKKIINYADKGNELTDDNVLNIEASQRLLAVNEIDDTISALFQLNMQFSERTIESITFLDEMIWEFDNLEELTATLAELKTEVVATQEELTELKEDYEMDYKSIFGPDFATSVSEEELATYQSKIDWSRFGFIVGDLMIRDIQNRTTKVKKTLYEELEYRRYTTSQNLDSVKFITLWAYALGTLFALLAKFGDYYRERSAEC